MYSVIIKLYGQAVSCNQKEAKSFPMQPGGIAVHYISLLNGNSFILS
jgi:hypothetical protein